MLGHLQSDANWTGQSPPWQEEAENHRHLAASKSPKPRGPRAYKTKFNFYQDEILSKIGQMRCYSIYPFELLGAGGEQTHQQPCDPPQEPWSNREEKSSQKLQLLKPLILRL